MIDISTQEFEQLLGEALDSLPKKYTERLLESVAVTWDDEPSAEQRHRLQLRHDQTLFGLYEGVPLTHRYNGGMKVTPDKITVFKGPISRACNNLSELREQIRHTLWHEMAHFYGLDHPRIHELE